MNAPSEAAVSWGLKLQTAARADAPATSQAAFRSAQARPFRRLGVSQTTQSDTLASLSAQLSPETPAELAQKANESFLVTGSPSQGLQGPRDDMFFGPGVTGPDGMVGASGPPEAGTAMAGMAGRGGPGMGGRGGEGPMGGAGGPGGGPGGDPPGGGGPGGGPMGDPVAAAGGRQDQRGAIAFGNRANRGRQEFRGDISYSLDNSALNARSYSLTGQTVEKPSHAQSRFALSFGGPLRVPEIVDSDKTFLVLDYSGTRSRTA